MMEDRLRAAPWLPEGKRTLLMLTAQASWGYLVALKTLRSGGTICFAPFPDQCVELCDNFGVEYICASVTQAATLVEEQKKRLRDLQSVAYLQLSGSVVAPALVDELRRFVCRNVVIAYGATESGQVTSALHGAIVDVAGAVGYVHPGVEIEIVDDNDRVLSAGQTGAVRVKSPGRANGYIASTGEVEGLFKEGWFYPGDRGSLRTDGLLAIEGRTSDLVLNKGGFKMSPAIIEHLLQEHTDIVDAGVVAGTSPTGAPEIWAALVATGVFNPERLHKQYEDKMGPYAPDRIFRVERIPRNELGKIQYKILKDMLSSMTS
jgi:long-chain acyl-CoA synthetase